MKNLISVLFIAASLTAAAIAADSAASQIKSAISHLRQSVQDRPIADKDFASVVNTVNEDLKAAAAAANNGQLYLALEKLGQVQDLWQGARRATDKADIEKGGLTAFQSEWAKASVQLTALDKDARALTWNNSPLAVRALAEAAQGRAIPLLEGAQGFAVATKPMDGLFYMGQAAGEADFAKFCATLKFTGIKPAAFPLRSLLPELHALQEKTNAAFQPPQSIQLHSRFIALNSTLKLAQELDPSRFYAGAMFAYLEAVRHYAMLTAKPLDTSAQSELKQSLAAKSKELAASPNDESIAQLFLQRADSYITHFDGSAPSADEWRGARVILDQVLPAYYDAQKPAAPLQQTSTKTVEITLVRWPYT